MVRFLLLSALGALVFASTTAAADVRVTTWNLKHLGRTKQDLQKVADVLKSSDLILLQEVNSSKTGAKALANLAKLVGEQANAKFCVGLSEIPTDAKERYGMLWREDRLSYVTTSGKPMDDCSPYAVTLRLGTKDAAKIVREPAVGLFKEKSTGGKFWVATIHTVPTAKHPANEIPSVFETAVDVAGKLPVLVAGDFNLSCDDASFKVAKDGGFTEAIACSTKSSLKRTAKEMNAAYDNILARGLKASGGEVVDLYARFPALSAAEVFNSISDHAPVTAIMAVTNEPSAAAH